MSSKHANAGLLIRRGLYDNLRSFAELEQRISALGDEHSKVVGDALEVFVEGYLATHQKLQAEAVWLVGQVPQDIRLQLNLPKDAKGIDGVFRTRTGILVPYQVKFRSQRAYLTYTEIAPFLGLTERATDRIVFTNSNELAEDVKNRDAMRTVRGIDFDDLTKDELRAISAWLREQPVAIKKPQPREYQIEALAKISNTLVKSDRALVVMAPGTGKTLVALWAAEALKPKTVLVLLPSLTLLQQTLDEWSRHNSWGNDFTYLCVCSDPTVAARDEYDPVRLEATDLEFRVDTSPDEVRRFIERGAPGVKVVFSTYQSSPVVSQGVRGLAPFDVAIFDEAHKTTGPQGGLFAHSLKDENIRICKRLFFTATPRHYDIRHRDKEGDFRLNSMDDEAVYGPRAYTLTFGSAARQGIICNYKVVISVVDGQEINEFAIKHSITLVEGDLIGAKWVANQIAVERAVEKTGAKRAITFHSRISSAKEFSSDGTHGIKQFLPEFSIFHVNGDQKSSERKQIIRWFRDASEGLITNARCLTEGIDVPAVDTVAFIDPRHSRVDIAQATGRAMRKPPGLNKEIGYVVIPLFLDRRSGETLEEALERSEFDDVADVLNAMQEQDEDLVQIIRELQEAKGRGEIFNPRRLPEKIEVLGPSIELSALRANICAEIVHTIGVSWDEGYGRLTLYKAREGHCRVPQGYIENGYRLGQWVSIQRQRQNKGALSEERRERLDKIGFVWDPFEADWDEGFGHLKIYKEHEGHCFVPATYNQHGFRLGGWVRSQRSHKDRLSEERRQRLEQLGFVWDARGSGWDEGFRYLAIYQKRTGHCRVPALHEEDGYPLGQWVDKQRQRKGILPKERRQRLDELGFVWDVLDAAWEDGLRYLAIYQKRTGHCRVPALHEEDGYRLGQWVSVQRLNKAGLSEERRQKLSELGFVWDPHGTTWEKGFEQLQAFVKNYKHCRVPTEYKTLDGYPLGGWVARQRHSDALSTERKARLDAIGFEWDPVTSLWEEGLEHLQAFVNEHKYCLVPRGYKSPDGYQLGNWVSNQRQSQHKLSSEQKARLDALGSDWDPITRQWEEGFGHLQAFVREHKHCRVSQKSISPDGYRLGQWVSVQRGLKARLSIERKERLDALGFDWDPISGRWEEGLEHLQAFVKEHKYCRVPAGYRSPDGYQLGNWVGNQRQSRNRLSAERKGRLDALGFDWDPFTTQWEEGLECLQSFFKEHKHCRVSRDYITLDGFPLGAWIHGQRRSRDKLSAERKRRLDALGFAWDPP
jgi:superfamily II DNA or RNA helicase